MSQDSILRIPRSDSSGDYALIKVSKSGASDLDLQLVGTEGETPYVGSRGFCLPFLRHGKLLLHCGNVVSQNMNFSDLEWNQETTSEKLPG